MKRSTSWIVFLIVIATVLVPRNTAAQSDRAGDDKTLSPYFFVENGDPAVDRADDPLHLGGTVLA